MTGVKHQFDAEELNLIKLAKDYQDEDKARALLESIRWPNGPVCPHCKAIDPYKLTPQATSKRPGRKGLYKCRKCTKQFTVTVGTIFEASHIPISKWLMAVFILCSSKKAVSSHQLHRMLDCTYKTAWFMSHRLRHAMHPSQPLGKLLEGTVEVDEAYIGARRPRPHYKDGKRVKSKPGRGTKKIPIVALIQRDGSARVKVVPNVTAKNLRDFVNRNVSKDATVNSDSFLPYRGLFRDFKRHDRVNHYVQEYARHNPDGTVSGVNNCESFFALFKRGITGSWHHVSKEHLPKYAAEFAFRWDHRKISDGERMVKAIETTEGKRLLYKDPIPTVNKK
jgi:transposase-like protein